MKREKLPKDYENRYKSESLKEKIVDDGMWLMIPAVTGDINSAFGIRRLKKRYLTQLRTAEENNKIYGGGSKPRLLSIDMVNEI